MSNAREQELVSDLCTLVAKHAEWLDGPAWLAIVERVGRGYFDDIPELFDADALLAALSAELKDG